MLKKNRINLIATVTLVAIVGNGLALSKKVDTVHGKNLTPLQVLSRSEQELNKKKEKEDTSKKDEDTSNEKYYTSDKGNMVKEVAVEVAGVKEDIEKEEAVKTVTSDGDMTEVAYEVTPKDSNINIILDEDLVDNGSDSNNNNNNSEKVSKLDNVKDKYTDASDKALEEQKKKEESINKEIEDLDKQIDELENSTNSSKDEDGIITIKDNSKDESKDLEEQKKAKEKELATIKEKQDALQKEKEEQSKKAKEDAEKLANESKNIDLSVLKVIGEKTGQDGKSYVKVVNKSDGKVLGWISKDDISGTYQSIKSTEESKSYYKVKDGAKAYSSPSGTIGSEEVSQSYKYVNTINKVTLSDGSIWYSVGDSIYFAEGDLEDSGKGEILATIGDDTSVKTLTDIYGKSENDIKEINPFKDLNKLKKGDTVVIQKKDMLEVYKPSDYSKNETTQKFLSDLVQYSTEIKSAGLLPSVTIGQAMLESGGGTSKLSTEAHNLFGIKGSYNGASKSWSTQEDYGSGMVTINDTFRTYPSMRESILDYADLLTGATGNNRYKDVVGETDPEKAITIIKNGGYATDPNYISSVLSTIDKYNLTILDK